MDKLLGITMTEVVAALAFAGTLALTASPAAASTTCNRVASPSGSNANRGTVAAPFKTARRLVSSLGPGQTGCLRAGVYRQDITMRTRGTGLTSYPGETATIVGRFWADADHTTIKRLHLDGVNSGDLPSPTINADWVTFSHDDVTNEHTAICFDVGSDAYGTATGTVIRADRIHDCGVLPAANHDHGIYLEAAYDTRIEWNLIYGNADRGIQLYPDAQHTLIRHNVIDGNGENIDFSGDHGKASNGSDVYDNLLTDSHLRYDVESWYPNGNPVGRANKVHDNCLWGGRLGVVDQSAGGFSTSANRIADPGYVDAHAGNFTLRPGSPCTKIGGAIAAVVAGKETVAHATRGRAQQRRPKAQRTRRGRPRRK